MECCTLVTAHFFPANAGCISPLLLFRQNKASRQAMQGLDVDLYISGLLFFIQGVKYEECKDVSVPKSLDSNTFSNWHVECDQE